MNHEENKIMSHRQHVKYFMRFLNILPSSLSSHDTTRVTIAYFSVSGLDVLGAISSVSLDLRNRIIEWIYRLQVHPDKNNGDVSMCGFQGSSTINIDLDPPNNHYRCGHLAMTYTGLCILLALGDDLSRVNRKALVGGVKALQTEEGNFAATLSGCESDMRFVYCAACISYMLNDWSGFNIEKATDYIIKSIVLTRTSIRARGAGWKMGHGLWRDAAQTLKIRAVREPPSVFAMANLGAESV